MRHICLVGSQALQIQHGQKTLSSLTCVPLLVSNLNEDITIFPAFPPQQPWELSFDISLSVIPLPSQPNHQALDNHIGCVLYSYVPLYRP